MNNKVILELYEYGLCHPEIADILSVSQLTIYRVLKGFGFTQGQIDARRRKANRTAILDTLGFKRIVDVGKCEQCEILLAESPDSVPAGWSWAISGRYGDICNACHFDMNKKEKARMNKLVRIGCVVCRRETGGWVEPEIHHVRRNLGIGQRRNHMETIPLCPEHHRTGGLGVAFHAGEIEWIKRHGDELFLLDIVNEVLDD